MVNPQFRLPILSSDAFIAGSDAERSNTYGIWGLNLKERMLSSVFEHYKIQLDQKTAELGKSKMLARRHLSARKPTCKNVDTKLIHQIRWLRIARRKSTLVEEINFEALARAKLMEGIKTYEAGMMADNQGAEKILNMKACNSKRMHE